MSIADLNALQTDAVLSVCLAIEIPATPTVYITDNNEDIVFNGSTYVPFPFKMSELNTASKGEVPELQLQIDNTSRVIEQYLQLYDHYLKLHGNSGNEIEVTLYVVNTKDPNTGYGAAWNQDGSYYGCAWDQDGSYTYATWDQSADSYTGGHFDDSTADSYDVITYDDPDADQYTRLGTGLTSAIMTEYFLLTSFSTDSTWATFKLGAASPFTMRYPRRRIIQNFCAWKFKSERCGYEGSGTTCDKTLATCRLYGNSSRFGGFPGVGRGVRL